MKKLVFSFFFLFLVFSKGFCSSEKQSIEKVVEDYQNAVNTRNKNKLQSLFVEPDSYDVQMFLKYLDLYQESGLNFQYKIDVIELIVNGSIAEARLKTVTKLVSDDSSVDLMVLLGTSLIDSVMTLRKVNGTWKIVGEKVLE